MAPNSCPCSARKSGRPHSIAARTSAARLRLGGVAPGSCPLCTRGWAARGSSYLRSRTASRLVLLRRVCRACTALLRRVGWRGAQSLALALLVKGGWRAASTYALAHRCGSYFCGAGGWRGAQTLALALQAKVSGARLRLALSHSVAARKAMVRLRLGGTAPDSCPRSAREGGGARLRLALGGARLRLALLYSITARAAARLRLGGVAPDSCPRSAREGGGARLRLTLSRRVAARVLLRCVCDWATWRPDSCPRSTRGRHAAHLHSRTSSRLVLVLLRHVCGGGVAPNSGSCCCGRGGARLRLITLSRRVAAHTAVARLRLAVGQSGVQTCPRSTREGRRRAAPNKLSHVVAARAATARLRFGGAAPNSCPRSAREGGRRAV